MKLTDFDKIVCLAVDRRKDMWRNIEDEVKRRGASVDFFVVGDGHLLPPEEYDLVNIPTPSSFVGIPMAYNCFRSYQRIVQLSMLADLNNILLLQDDVEFLPNFDEVLAAAGEQLKSKAPEWDVLYLGANHTWATTYEVGPNLLKLHGSFCWHAIALNKTVFPEIMSWQPTMPEDLMATRLLHPRYNCYGLWPNVAIQKPGLSVLENRDVDFTDYWLCKGNPHYPQKAKR